MKKIVLLFALLFSGLGFAQSINDYKYLVLPEKFEWLNEKNEYSLNSLTKMMFEKYGWEVYYANQKMPDELALDKCKALYGDVLNQSGLMSTTLVIVLKNCEGKTVFTSAEGKSREKAYQKAYYAALREASVSVEQLNYKYSGKNGATTKAAAPVVAHQQAATPVTVNNENQLFAQPITNGYQLVDNTPKVVLKIYKTSQQDSYTAVSDTKNGVVFKKGNDWIFEYYQNDKLVSEKLNIKF